ncbi:unnamed protein product [Danaus chrysippus]|uniref:(African queen) hypothetical protein n=1 Tax=Danaus chrysippus TaxID=151541 RepID=A0A8J2VX52_9NEOP|nr:unnamed protein product [Danaus chrysippus]
MCDINANRIIQRVEDLRVELQDTIRNIVKKEGYKDHDIKVIKLKTNGDNYLGSLYEIDIKGVVEDEKKETNIFAKVILNPDITTTVSLENLYLIELFVYNELSKIFHDVQEEAKVPITERYNIARSYQQKNNNMIVLENLSRKGFKVYNRLDVMSLKFAELCIQQLARFHGLSFVIEKKMPEFFNKRIRILEHPIVYNDELTKLVKQNSVYTINLFEGDEKMRIEKFASSVLQKMKKYNLDRNCICCMTHGDFRISNIMVREKEGEAVEVVPVDYQLLDCGCPVRDFLYFIFTGTDQKFRRQHMNHLKDLYYETMTKFLNYFDMKAEDVFPRKEFEKIEHGLHRLSIRTRTII